MLEISIKPEVLGYIGAFPLTNAQLTSWLSSLLLIVVAIVVGVNYKKLPSGLQSIIEMVYEFFQSMAEDAMGAFGRRFVPLAMTFFLFIVVSNWLGVLPGVGSLVSIHDPAKAVSAGIIPFGASAVKAEAPPSAEATVEEEHAYVPVFRGGNADLNTTLALAIIAQVIIHAMGIRTAGLAHHLAHFKNPLEIITELSKILTFGFRLFGNVFAGEVLLTVMGSLVVVLTGKLAPALPFGLVGGAIAIPFVMLELFVGAIQALVFAMLVLSFLSLFVKTDQSASHH